MRHFAVLLVFLFSSVYCFSQLVTGNTLTPTQLVQNVLLGPGITASNVTFTGYSNAIGEFNITGVSNLGLTSGVIMTTGTILANDPTYGVGAGPDGPNNLAGAGCDNAQPGNTFLTTVAGATTFNAAVLEFDFIPQSDTVKFRYVFGTDEYMEYVSGGFADVFAFVLSGVSTPLAPTNIALIPGTTTPVTALNVNANVNAAFYVDNENPPGQIIQYDGFTIPLTARYPVICGQTYHIQLMIADALDGAVDAGVFLEAGSFSSSAPVSITSTNPGSLGGYNSVYEGCGPLNLLFIRPDVSSQDTVNFLLTGTSSVGDYTGINPDIIFPVGVDTVVIPLTAIFDGVNEGTETLILNYLFTNPCGVTDTISYTINIIDYNVMNVVFPIDTLICANQSAILTAIPTSGLGPYSFNWASIPSGNISTQNPFLTGPLTNNQSYVVQVTDACNNSVSDTVNVNVGSSLFMTASLDVVNSVQDTLLVEGCDSAVITFTEQGLGAGIGTHSYPIIISGSGLNGTDISVSIPLTITFVNSTIVQIPFSAVFDGISEGTGGLETITINLSQQGTSCITASTQTVEFYIKDVLPFQLVLPADTTICRGRSISISAQTLGGGGNISFNWLHNSSSAQSQVLIPIVSTTYTVSATESCGPTTKIDSVRIDVIFDPPILNSLSVDTVCAGEKYTFNTFLTGGISPTSLVWLPGNPTSVIDLGNQNWEINPVEFSGMYIVQASDRCNFVDTDTLFLVAQDCELSIPNVVTPNGDGVNEYFEIKNIEKFPETSLLIFDRWGKLVFQSQNYRNEYKPSEVSDGTYYFILTPVKKESIKGFFHVFKSK